MTDLDTDFPETLAILASEVDEQLFTRGAQIALVVDGDLVLSEALGDDGLGRPVTTETVFRVYCTIKPVASLAVARMVDDGRLDLDAPLSEHLPDFASVADGAVALRDLLSHAAGLHHPTAVEVELISPDRRDEFFRQVTRPAGWRVGTDVAYSERFAWQLVGVLLERVSGEPLREHLRSSVLDPLDLGDTWIGMTDAEYDDVLPRLGVNHDMRTHKSYPLLLERGRRMCTEVNCAHGGYTTATDLAWFYASILEGLAGAGPAAAVLPSAATLRTFTSPVRPPALDRILGRECQHGLGFLTDLTGHEFGSAISTASFGHSGNVGSSFAWADPERGVAGAVVFNGIVDPDSAFLRRPAIVRAIARDLDAFEGLDPEG